MLGKFVGRFEDEVLTGFWKEVWGTFSFMQDQVCLESFRDTWKLCWLKKEDFIQY
jgi:hypothetical protein